MLIARMKTMNKLCSCLLGNDNVCCFFRADVCSNTRVVGAMNSCMMLLTRFAVLMTVFFFFFCYVFFVVSQHVSF